ncbi:MAG TPA: DUF2911 domain-containing protein [Flavisolibacter sp.]|nr:DUF2911 domain-containing protein [Flavisolibacter sp.]
MKYLCSLFFLFSLLSCKNQNSVPAPRLELSKDTNIIKSESYNPYEPIDVSPMDMSYLPNDYPILKMENKTTKSPVARVIYSRPRIQGRKIFGSLIKYGEPWRLGANEATEIQLFQPVTIQKKLIPAGRYVLYCIPRIDKWTIVFNGNFDCWGLKQDPSKDLYKFDISPITKEQPIEYFTMVFEKTPSGADLVTAWDNIEARLPFQYTEK